MISESGGAERVWSKAAATAVSKGYGELWHKQTAQDLASLKTAPRRKPHRGPTRLSRPTGRNTSPSAPRSTDEFLPQMPVKAIAAGSSQGKRLLIGTNRDESALFIGPHPDTDPAPRDLGNISAGQIRPSPSAIQTCLSADGRLPHSHPRRHRRGILDTLHPRRRRARRGRRHRLHVPPRLHREQRPPLRIRLPLARRSASSGIVPIPTPPTSTRSSPSASRSTSPGPRLSEAKPPPPLACPRGPNTPSPIAPP